MRFILSLFFLPWLCIGLLIANLIQVLSLVLWPFSRAAFRAVNRWVAGTWFNSLVFVVERVLGVRVVFTGDPLPIAENAFVISNHQSMMDIPVLVTLAKRCERSGDIKWFVKDPLKWVPGIGWGMLFLDCLFVKRNWLADKDMITETFARLRNHRVPFWVLSFVEGTRLTPSKLRRAQGFEEKTGQPLMRNVMSPRTKGFEATLEGLGTAVAAVYDLTIAYENFPVGRVPGLLSLFFGPVERVHVHGRRFVAAEIPAEARATWILARFREKDARLAEFRKTGKLG